VGAGTKFWKLNWIPYIFLKPFRISFRGQFAVKKSWSLTSFISKKKENRKCGWIYRSFLLYIGGFTKVIHIWLYKLLLTHCADCFANIFISHIFKYRIVLFAQPSLCFHILFLRKQNTYSHRLRLFCAEFKPYDGGTRDNRPEDLYFGASSMHSTEADWNKVSHLYTLLYHSHITWVESFERLHKLWTLGALEWYGMLFVVYQWRQILRNPFDIGYRSG